MVVIDCSTKSFMYFTFVFLAMKSLIYPQCHITQDTQCHVTSLKIRTPINFKSSTDGDQFWCFALYRHVVSWNRCLADFLGTGILKQKTVSSILKLVYENDKYLKEQITPKSWIRWKMVNLTKILEKNLKWSMGITLLGTLKFRKSLFSINISTVYKDKKCHCVCTTHSIFMNKTPT